VELVCTLSDDALAEMVDVGFTNIRLSPVIQITAGKRILAVGQKDQHRDMMRSGLSVRRTS